MAKYSDIKGFTVQTVSSDPVASGLAGASWSSTPSLNTGRIDMSSGGTTTAGIVAGGYDGEGYPSGYTGLTETWDGSSWTETADMNSGRTSHGFGTQTSLIAGAGNRGVSSPPTAPGYQNLVESWNGSAWTEVAEYNNNRSARGTAGQSGTAGIVFGGIIPAGGVGDYTESWNGSSWTEVSDLNASRYNLATNAGTQTSALGVGGQYPSPPTDGTLVESWNGSSWTEVSELNTARNQMGGSGTGNTSLLVFGGNPGVKANTESWDGSSWTERNDLATARKNNGGLGTSATNAIYAGGQDSTNAYIGTSEEFSPAGPTESLQIEGQLFFNSTTNTFKETITDLGAGSWASGANINTAREGTSGAGDSAEAALLIGGYTTSAPTVRVANTESWDGSSWTEVNDLNQARYVLQSVGTSTAALAFGGDTPPNTGKTESWNGSSWTETTDLNTARANLGGTGPYTSALAVGGYSTAYTGDTETWDGSSWTEVNNLNEARGLQSSVGVTQTASLAVTGDFPQATNVEQWDGSSWTEIAEVNTGRYNSSGSGSATLGLIFGGRIFPGTPPAAYSALTESWNGTAWTERADLATARGDGASAQNISNNSKALYFSGSNPPYVYTEEWTAPLANKTITTS